MTTEVLASSPPNLSAFPRALVRLCARSQRELWGLRLTRLYGIGIGVSYAIMALVMALDVSSAARLWLRCLETASWVAGIGALSLATDLPGRDASQGLLGLAHLRGFDARTLERARTLAGALRLSSTIAIPGCLLAFAVGLKLRSLPGTLAALNFLLLSLLFAALVGAVLASLARAASRALPLRGRLLFLALTLGPWLASMAAGGGVPSIPGAFAWLLEHLSQGFT